jgi:predicted kinase
VRIRLDVVSCPSRLVNVSVPTWWAGSQRDRSGAKSDTSLWLDARPRRHVVEVGFMIVLVNGLPASGKSTLALALGSVLDWPVVSKDVIKDALRDHFGASTRDESRRLGRAAIDIMYRLARSMPVALLDSVFDGRLAPADLARLHRPWLEVYCDVPLEVARSRFHKRQAALSPAPGEEADWPAWVASAGQPLGLGPLLRVDTTRQVDVRAVAHWILRQQAAAGPSL